MQLQSSSLRKTRTTLMNFMLRNPSLFTLPDSAKLHSRMTNFRLTVDKLWQNQVVVKSPRTDAKNPTDSHGGYQQWFQASSNAQLRKHAKEPKQFCSNLAAKDARLNTCSHCSQGLNKQKKTKTCLLQANHGRKSQHKQSGYEKRDNTNTVTPNIKTIVTQQDTATTSAERLMDGCSSSRV